MSAIRLIALALVVWLAFHMLRRLFKPDRPRKTGQGTPKNMVRCAQCGLHLPETEAITYQDRHYCCAEHRHLHTRPS